MNELSTINNYGNLWVRELVFTNTGSVKKGHRHSFDHIHFVAHGSVKLTTIKDSVEISTEIYTAPSWVKVPKEVYHTIEALEPMTLGYCIQALRDNEGEVMSTNYTEDTCIDRIPSGI